MFVRLLLVVLCVRVYTVLSNALQFDENNAKCQAMCHATWRVMQAYYYLQRSPNSTVGLRLYSSKFDIGGHSRGIVTADAENGWREHRPEAHW